jgi:hypothetical protein
LDYSGGKREVWPRVHRSGLAMPVMLGFVGIAGWSAGAGRANVKVLRFVFSGVIGVLAIEMIYSGITGRL